MDDKNRIIKKVIGFLQECYSFLIIILYIYYIMLSVNVHYWDGEMISILIVNIAVIILNVLLFILAELVSKQKYKQHESLNKKENRIAGLVCIIVFNCICLAINIALFTLLTRGSVSWLTCVKLSLSLIPLLIIVVLASISIKLTISIRKQKDNCDN